MDLLSERNSIILIIILGIMALAFPMVPVSTLGMLLTVIVFFIALVLLIRGWLAFSDSKVLGGAAMVLALLCFIFSCALLVNIVLVSEVLSIIIYLFALLTIVLGVFYIISGKFAVFSAVGLSIIVFAIITLITAFCLTDTRIVGGVVGLWLVISGLLSLFTDHDKNYINI